MAAVEDGSVCAFYTRCCKILSIRPSLDSAALNKQESVESTRVLRGKPDVSVCIEMSLRNIAVLIKQPMPPHRHQASEWAHRGSDGRKRRWLDFGNVRKYLVGASCAPHISLKSFQLA